jgi:CDP-diacylglycerol--glycerol-3-phosphate 3-phosphatidyltransferase
MNWPNGLTVARLILAPVVLACLLTGAFRLALYVFVIAMLTDLYDGYLARLSDRVTEFGKLMDPLADKVLVSLVLVGLLFLGVPFVSPWMVAVIIGRELLILGCRTGVFKSGEVLVTRRTAKWKTASQMVWLAAGLLYLSYGQSLGLAPASNGAHAVERALWYVGLVSVGLTVVSGAQYMIGRRNPNEPAPRRARREGGTAS